MQPPGKAGLWDAPRQAPCEAWPRQAPIHGLPVTVHGEMSAELRASVRQHPDQADSDLTPTESTGFLMGLVLCVRFHFIFLEKLKCQAKKFTPRLCVKCRQFWRRGTVSWQVNFKGWPGHGEPGRPRRGARGPTVWAPRSPPTSRGRPRASTPNPAPPSSHSAQKSVQAAVPALPLASTASCRPGQRGPATPPLRR